MESWPGWKGLCVIFGEAGCRIGCVTFVGSTSELVGDGAVPQRLGGLRREGNEVGWVGSVSGYLIFSRLEAVDVEGGGVGSVYLFFGNVAC